MLDLSIILPPVIPALLLLTVCPAFRARRKPADEQPLFTAPNVFNYLLADQRGISAMEYTVVAGASLSVAWVVFVALGQAFLETNGAALV